VCVRARARVWLVGWSGGSKICHGILISHPTFSIINNQHFVDALMWPNNRIFVDLNLVCPKTLGMNQQSVRLVEQFERTNCIRHLHLYVSFARHKDRGVALFLFVLLICSA